MDGCFARLLEGDRQIVVVLGRVLVAVEIKLRLDRRLVHAGFGDGLDDVREQPRAAPDRLAQEAGYRRHG